MRYQFRILLTALCLAPAFAKAQQSDSTLGADSLSTGVSAQPRPSSAMLTERAFGLTAPGAVLGVTDKSRLSSDAAKSDGSSPSWGRYVGVGMIAGAALGTAAAFFVTHQSSVTDHSEDGLAYILFIPAGFLIGAVVGGVVGMTR